MSFDMYLMKWRGKESMPISSDDFQIHFKDCPEIKKDEFGVYPTYDEANDCEIYGLDEPGGIQISRPCGDKRLWNSIYSLMKTDKYTLIWPGIDCAIAAQGIPVEDIDDDFMFEFMRLKIVLSYDEIFEILERT